MSNKHLHLEDMEDLFYEQMAELGNDFIRLPGNHPLKIVSTMFRIAKEGQTDLGWQLYAMMMHFIAKGDGCENEQS